MRVYFNRALLYKEWKLVRWIILAMTVVMCYFQFTDINSFIDMVDRSDLGLFSGNNYAVKRLFTFSGTTVIIIFMIIGAAYLIIGMDRSKNHEKLMSMPFSKDEMILTKLYMALMIIAIPVIVSYLLTVAIFYSNYSVLHYFISVSIINDQFLLNLLTYMAILLFLMFIHCLCGKGIGASIIGAILLVVPLALPTLIYELLWINTRHLSRNSDYTIIDKISKTLDITSYNQINSGLDVYHISRYFVLIVMILLLMLGIYISFIKGKTERIGNLVIFYPVEVILKIGVGICGGLLISSIVISGTNYVYGGLSYVAVMDLLFVLSFILCYFIINKIIESNKV